MLSIVVPVMNEEEVLPLFYKELTTEVKKLKKAYEIIFIDDGSRDNSLSILQSFAKSDKTIRIFSFRRNLGKAEALTYGFAVAKGDHVVMLDADLQDKPSEISQLLKKFDDGYEVVCGWRKDRKDTGFKVVTSRIFNKTVGLLFGLQLHDYNCGLKAFTNDAAKSLRLYGGLHRFIPLLCYQQGFRVTEVPVHHAPRTLGKSKYNFTKVWTEIPDMFTMIFIIKYSKRPLHFFGIIGSIVSLVGTSIVIYFTLLHMLTGKSIGGRPLLFIGMLCVLAGMQIFFTGFLADFILNISQSSRKVEESMEDVVKYKNS